MDTREASPVDETGGGGSVSASLPDLNPLGPPDPPPRHACQDGTDAVTDDERFAYIRALIASRCPELGPDDLALLAPPPDPEMVPASVFGQVVEVLDQMIARQDRFEAQLAAAEPIPAVLH
jgi:hypothetical protein